MEKRVGYEVDFLNVGDGSGDAICLRYGSPQTGYTIHLIDGGHTETSGKIIGHITECYSQYPTINHLVLSHADDDHARGLIGVINEFPIGIIWMNRPWLYADHVMHNFHGNWSRDGLIKEIKYKHPYLVEIEDIAAKRGIPVFEAFQGTQIGQFTVLAPSRQRYVSLIHDLSKTPQSYAEERSGFGGMLGKAKEILRSVAERWDIETLDTNPPATSSSNETSVVQLGHIDGDKVLLTADVGPDGLHEAAVYAHNRGMLSPPNLVQIPHHGSRRNVTPRVLDMWLGQRLNDPNGFRGKAFCSVGTNKTDHPRKKVANAFTRRGYGVFCTHEGNIRHHKDMLPREGWNNVAPLPLHAEVEA